MKEITLNLNEFKTLDVATGIQGALYQILNVILMKPGTVPNMPKMGAYIKSYLQELVTDSLIDTMKTEIRSQISTYVPQAKILQMDIKSFIDSISGKPVFVMGFILLDEKYDQNTVLFEFKQDYNGDNIRHQIFMK